VPVSVHDLSIERDAVLSSTLANEVDIPFAARSLEYLDTAAVAGMLVGVESLHDLILRAKPVLVKGWRHPFSSGLNTGSMLVMRRTLALLLMLALSGLWPSAVSAAD